MFNARCLVAQHNTLAQQFVQEFGVCGTVGSDAHTLGEYGTATQKMQPFHDEASFLESLRTAQPIEKLSSFYVHFGSTFAKWLRKFTIGSPRLIVTCG